MPIQQDIAGAAYGAFVSAGLRSPDALLRGGRDELVRLLDGLSIPSASLVRRFPAWLQPVQGTHGSGGILQQFRKSPALHTESPIGCVLDFLKTHRDPEN